MMERKTERLRKDYTLLRAGRPSPSSMGEELSGGRYPLSWPCCFMAQAQESQAGAAAVATQVKLCPVCAHNEQHLTLPLILPFGSGIYLYSKTYLGGA